MVQGGIQWSQRISSTGLSHQETRMCQGVNHRLMYFKHVQKSSNPSNTKALHTHIWRPQYATCGQCCTLWDNILISPGENEKKKLWNGGEAVESLSEQLFKSCWIIKMIVNVTENILLKAPNRLLTCVKSKKIQKRSRWNIKARKAETLYWEGL